MGWRYLASLERANLNHSRPIKKNVNNLKFKAKREENLQPLIYSSLINGSVPTGRSSAVNRHRILRVLMRYDTCSSRTVGQRLKPYSKEQ
jgi:hypothetical protein